MLSIKWNILIHISLLDFQCVYAHYSQMKCFRPYLRARAVFPHESLICDYVCTYILDLRRQVDSLKTHRKTLCRVIYVQIWLFTGANFEVFKNIFFLYVIWFKSYLEWLLDSFFNRLHEYWNDSFLILCRNGRLVQTLAQPLKVANLHQLSWGFEI